ncbi:hypothetical protein B9G69_008955 [Bdellovibrio sp. SKB1291214]|uniref:hypothetical protein n=1 Tax=Bdellovibrio sp. SKB1291214 TaxID=1732569 RepID=UPI000B515ED2|nr:hypothetical protein [Bdellovibrio sp. SKB1291214]UYL10703.1 hypothetical protein B9G69_008955 [Bdellovibrio sp. SKB1291214]
MQKFVGVFGLLFVCFGAGYSIVHYNTSVTSIDRDPAAVRSNFDFSNLSGERLQEAVKQRLVTGFEVKKTPDASGFTLGHFVFVDQYGQKKLACQEFSKISLVFEAEGVSVSGEKPSMELEGTCEYSKDMAKINPLWLPVAKILGEKPADGEFQFNEGSGVVVRFANLPDHWPTTWLLKTVKMKTLNNPDLVIQSNEVAKYLGHPVVLTF